MRYRRAFVLLVVIGIFAAACGGESTDDTGSPDTTTADTSDTTEGVTDTTVDQTSTTTALVDLSHLEGFSPGHACYFSAHHLFVPEGDGANAASLLNDSGITAVDGYIEDPVEDIELDGALVPLPFDGAVDVVTIADGSPNAFLVVEFLRENGIAARPVHMIGMTGHWQVKPGNDPEAVDQGLLWEPSQTPNGSATIAVVDTAVIETGFSWVLDGVEADFVSQADPHDVGSSHGTFIASLIRQTLPTVSVAFASLPAVDKSAYFQSWPDDDPSEDLGSFSTNMVTSEIPAYTAIYGLIDRLSLRPPAKVALSLSWGTYPCESQFEFDTPVEKEMDALGATMDAWSDAFEESPIFAAAGNEPPDYGPFYPAAFTDVVGVAADSGGDALVWVDGVATEANLPWADISAPGCDLVGVGGTEEPGVVVAWGGSSFATPLAAATWIALDLSETEAAKMSAGDMIAAPQVDLGRCDP